MIICEICNKNCNSMRGLGVHISKSHHDISLQEYYDTYIRKSNELLLCPVCEKNPLKFINLSIGYSRTCSDSCGQKHPETKAKKESTNLEKFGYVTPIIQPKVLEHTHSKEAMAKKRATMIEKHGIYSFFQLPEVQDKVKATFIDHFGVDNPAKSPIVQEKMQITCIERYGAKSPLESEIIQEKIKQTNIDRYGVDNPFKNKELMKNAYTYETRLKAVRTMKENGNYSSLENYLEQVLIDNNIKYEIQYNLDDRYPYRCDFYLPNTDIFVEINGYWTHNDHWFDENNLEDLLLLAKWEELAKDHSSYESAIRVWTKSDIEKRKCAKDNNLNYVVLWNMNDIINWIDTNFEIRHDYN